MSEPLIDDLLDRWETARAAGQSLRPDELCHDHPELLAELSERIRALAAMNGLLAGAPTCAGPPGGNTPHAGSTDEPLAADQEPVPGYRLVSRLGRGGSGDVWKAIGPGGFPVALKFVRLAGRAAEVELRALEVMKDTRHANLLATFGAWQPGELLIVAMELADRTLLDRFEEARGQGHAGIPGPELLNYMAEAARGLDFLNQPRPGETGGIQHRDVKPQNLLLVGGSVKVADFGLARLLAHTVTGHTGSMTPAYAAPEFFEGKTSGQSDQYSLAVTYCHLRTGRLPFAGTAAEVMAGHLHKPPDLSELPAAEWPVVGRALAKNPADRWPCCGAFVEALRTATAEVTPLMVRRPRRGQWLLVGAAVVVLLAAAGFAARSFLPIDFEPSNTTARGGGGKTTDTVTPPPSAKELFKLGRRQFLAQQNDEAIAVFSEAIRIDPKYAPAFAYRGWAYGRLHQGDKAIADANSALEYASSDDDELLTIAHYARGHGYRVTNQLDKAIAEYSITIRLKPGWGAGYHMRGVVYAAKGDRIHAQADQAKAKQLGDEPPEK